jgi:hypothetical protein
MHAMIGCSSNHLTHYNCIPVRIVRIEEGLALVQPTTSGPSWTEKQVPLSLLHNIRPNPLLPHDESITQKAAV